MQEWGGFVQELQQLLDQDLRTSPDSESQATALLGCSVLWSPQHLWQIMHAYDKNTITTRSKGPDAYLCDASRAAALAAGETTQQHDAVDVSLQIRQRGQLIT